MFRTIILSVIISLFSALNLDAATGDVSTVAGSGEAGMFGGGFSGDGGPATEALLDNPQGISIDADHITVLFSRLGSNLRREGDYCMTC